jgi:large subunit ribosomal protein L18
MTLSSREKRITRHKRIRSRISGTATCPRLAVYRSNAYIYAQLIDDVAGKTLVGAHDTEIKKGTKLEHAGAVGTEIAKKAVAAGIKTCVFDRGGFIYTGRIAALADAARAGGLIF